MIGNEKWFECSKNEQELGGKQWSLHDTEIKQEQDYLGPYP
jgi:hypothetical protein